MKVILLAAITADGFIARDINHRADWTSPEDKRFFVDTTKDAGIMIMGSTTFNTIGKALPGRKTIVYTRNPGPYSDIANVETTSETPADLIQRLDAAGNTAVCICGGSSIYTLFIKSGLVTDIYLTVEPVLFGSGIKLFSEELSIKLSLEDKRNLNNNTLLVHYAVGSNE